MTPDASPPSFQAWVVSITPFDREGRLDEDGLRGHLARMRAAGVGVFVGSSNAGEGFALTNEERARVFRIAAEELKGQVPVRAGGCEPQSVAAAVDYLQAAADAGLDGAHLFPLDTGHAGVPRPAEIERYYCQCLDSAGLPVEISNYPALGYGLPLELAQRLLQQYPLLTALRDAGTDTAYLRGLSAICKGRATLITGGIRNLMTALFHGSQGFLSSEANLAPALAVDVLRAYAAGDLPKLQASYAQLYQLHEFVNRFGGSAGRGIKPLLTRLGLPGGSLRAPRIALAGRELDDMVAAWQTLGL